MSTASSTPDVLIVGAGPAGLISALTLAQNGVSVRVIEKTLTNRIGQRGAGLMPRSLELFDMLGILPQVYEHSIKVPKFRMYQMPEGVDVVKEFYLSPPQEPTPSKPHVNPRLLGQDKLDHILRGELAKFGITVELGVELQSFEQFEDRVDVKLLKHSLDDPSAESLVEQASFKWVIGADGAKGAVRKLLGLTFLGETIEQNFVIGDIYATNLSEQYWHLWGDAKDVIISVRPTETSGLFNLIIGGAKLDNWSEICASGDALRQFLIKHIGNREDIKWGEIVCMGHYKVNVRMVDQFQKGRVFVAGDAAHVHSPTGGQGMNTGIQDAFNISWKLSLVAKGVASPTLLESFNEERLPVVAEMLNITTSILKKTLSDSRQTDPWNRSGDLHQLNVNYRGSSITVDQDVEANGEPKSNGSHYHIEAGDLVHAGDRAPDASGLVKDGSEEPTRLFRILKPTKHTVLIFADKVDYKSALASLEKYPKDLVHPILLTKAGAGVDAPGIDVFEDREGHAYEVYKGPEGTTGIYVIRPDGVVGCRAGDSSHVEQYFSKIFTAL